MGARAGHGAGKANTKQKDQARAAAMKDTAHRTGVERKSMRCPMGCGALIPRQIVGCKSSQPDGLLTHLVRCKGKIMEIRRG